MFRSAKISRRKSISKPVTNILRPPPLFDLRRGGCVVARLRRAQSSHLCRPCSAPRIRVDGDGGRSTGEALVSDGAAIFPRFGRAVVDSLPIVPHNRLVAAVSAEIESEMVAALHQFADCLIWITGLDIDPSAICHCLAGWR